MFWVPTNFPIDQALKIVEHHVLVGLYLLVSQHDSQVNTGRVHLVLVFDVLLPQEVKMML